MLYGTQQEMLQRHWTAKACNPGIYKPLSGLKRVTYDRRGRLFQGGQQLRGRGYTLFFSQGLILGHSTIGLLKVSSPW